MDSLLPVPATVKAGLARADAAGRDQQAAGAALQLMPVGESIVIAPLLAKVTVCSASGHGNRCRRHPCWTFVFLNVMFVLPWFNWNFLSVVSL